MSKFEKQSLPHKPGQSPEGTRRFLKVLQNYGAAAATYAAQETAQNLLIQADAAAKETVQTLLRKVDSMPPLAPEESALSENIETTKMVYEKVRLAQSLGMKENLAIPSIDDVMFDTKMTAIANQMDQFIEQCYKDFETTLAQDADMLALLTELEYAQAVAKEATAGDYRGLLAAEENIEEATLWQRVRLFFGGKAAVERGQAALNDVVNLQDKIVALAIQRFEVAGFNKDPKRALIAETATFSQVEKIIGIQL